MDEQDPDRWVDEARVTEAADARARRQWLRRQLDAEATLRSVLVDLAEREDIVTLRTASGSAITGSLTVVGADYVELAAERRRMLVPLAAVEVVRTPGRGPAGSARRKTDEGRRLTDVLSDHAAAGAQVTICTGIENLHGQLVAVGQDVLTLVVAGAQPTTAYVSLSSLAEVGLPTAR